MFFVSRQVLITGNLFQPWLDKNCTGKKKIKQKSYVWDLLILKDCFSALFPFWMEPDPEMLQTSALAPLKKTASALLQHKLYRYRYQNKVPVRKDLGEREPKNHRSAVLVGWPGRGWRRVCVPVLCEQRFQHRQLFHGPLGLTPLLIRGQFRGADLNTIFTIKPYLI